MREILKYEIESFKGRSNLLAICMLRGDTKANWRGVHIPTIYALPHSPKCQEYGRLESTPEGR